MGKSRGWRGDQPPEGSAFLRLSAGQTRYRLEGPAEGAPVLLVHGLTYPLEVWAMQARALAAAGFRVLRYDLWGRGCSEFDGRWLDPDALVNQALGVLDALDVTQPVSLVSLSNSDLISASLVRRAPARFRGLSWIAPSGYDPRSLRPSVRWLECIPGLRALQRWRLRHLLAQRMLNHRAQLPAETPAAVLDVYAFAIACARESPVFAAAVARQIGSAPSRDLIARDLRALAESGLPVQALHFAEERDVTPAAVQALADAVPQLEQAHISAGGHMGLLDQAAPVNAALLKFLRR